MADLYLQALMQGELLKKNLQHISDVHTKNRFDQAVEKQIEEYVKSLDFNDTPENQLVSPAMKRSQLKAKLREEAKQAELSKYITVAFQLLNTQANNYLSPEQMEVLQSDFAKGVSALEQVDLSLPLGMNFKTLMGISDASEESIGTFAEMKFLQGDYQNSLALYVLLATLVPESPSYWYHAAIASHKNKNFPQALKFYEAALALEPTLFGAKIFSCECYLQLSLSNEALQAYEEACEISKTVELEDAWKQLLEQLAGTLHASK